MRGQRKVDLRRGSKKIERLALICLPYKSKQSCVLTSAQKKPIILRASGSIDSRKNRCDAGELAHMGEQYSIELWTNNL